MSTRLALLRDSLRGLIDAVAEQDVPLPEKVAAAMVRANIAHFATRFVAPALFPVDVVTRGGIAVRLHTMHEGQLIGSFRDPDGLQLHSWNADGTFFDPSDPDDLDLMLPEDAPPAFAAGGTVSNLRPAPVLGGGERVVPILGCVS